MAVVLTIYFILLVLVSIYVAVNFYHVIRFRLDIPADRSIFFLTVYMVAVIGIWIVSIIMATISYTL